MNKKVYILSLLCLLFSSNVFSENPEMRTMTLNDCLVYAREHAHSNMIKRLDVAAAAVDKRIGVSDLMPNIGLGSSASLSFGRNIDPETNTYGNKKTLGSGISVDMSLPIFDGLVRINNLKALKTTESKRKKEQLVEEDRVSLEVIRNFYNISYCSAMVAQMERQLKRDSADLEASEIGLRLGTKSGADIAELEAVVAADRYELANQRNLLKKANLKLRSSMGMPITDIILPIVDTTFSDTGSPTRFILPEIEAAQLAVKESKLNLNIAKGGYSPRISFSAGISTSYYRMMGMGLQIPTFLKQLRDNMGEYLGLSFSFPIFDGLATANRVKKARITLSENEVLLEQTRYQIQQATEEAYLDMNAAVEELAAASSRLEAEQEAYRAIRRRYELGAASAIELYTSSSKLAVAEANLVGKRIQHRIAKITLRYYQGYPLIQE